MFGYFTSQQFQSIEQEIAESIPQYYDYSEDSSSLPTLAASYFYRINKSFSVGCTMGYGYESTDIYSRSDDKYAFTTHDNVLLISPTIQLHWLNTKYLELYSSMALIGYGVAFSRNADHLEGYNKVTQGIAMQFTPIALAPNSAAPTSSPN